MTRKQALIQAITILAVNEENREIINKFEEMIDEYPSFTWTEKSILDAIENYAVEHDNTLPHSKELTTENGLPSNTVINNKFGFTSMDKFFRQFFPLLNRKDKRVNSPYKQKGQKYYLETFMENYIRIQKQLEIKYVDLRAYDKYKEENTPHSCTIIKNCGCKSYNDLLILCGFKKKKLPLVAKINISYDDSEQRQLKLYNIVENAKRSN